ncbi:metallopeptidase TldD-related protein [Sphingomonas sp. G-3-2-10]|uniref:TldD/PmbA family protein n=1 Tax=Sphingomonas sp. G-3-2-10 TaxID=2728838 RepID=UPI00146D769F|nr:metallopeptidase TldD-related protein [Sphingomonas sp. G-3-2-10]NML07585.1 TldD/PmbA family protein [Sphingomonas sp. G-3-2-10]
MLNTEQARERVHDIVGRARRAGADAADAVLIADRSLSVSVRMGALEDVERSESAELGLRVFSGNRSASVSTSDLSSASLDTLVERVLAMAREAPEDPWAGLAPDAMLLSGSAPDLDLDDSADADPQAMRDRALEAEDAARAVPGVTNSEGGGASANRSVTALATSNGFTGGYAVTSHMISASVLAGSGGEMERDSAWHSARHAAMLEAPDAIGRLAGERAVSRLNPGRVASGAMPVVFDRRVSGGLLGHFIGAITGSSIARKTSFLQEHLGKQVFAKGVTLHEDPHRLRGLRSRPFDGEGLPVGPRRLVEDGVLQTWLMESASARQLGFDPTGHAARGIAGAPGAAPSNLWMSAGDQSFDALIADIDTGILVTELIGQGVNGVTGDYSRGAAGFLIDKGQIAGPVSEITIAGNLIDMFLAAIPASDLEFRYGINAPTLRIDGMTIAGD